MSRRRFGVAVDIKVNLIFKEVVTGPPIPSHIVSRVRAIHCSFGALRLVERVVSQCLYDEARVNSTPRTAAPATAIFPVFTSSKRSVRFMERYGDRIQPDLKSPEPLHGQCYLEDQCNSTCSSERNHFVDGLDPLKRSYASIMLGRQIYFQLSSIFGIVSSNCLYSLFTSSTRQGRFNQNEIGTSSRAPSISPSKFRLSTIGLCFSKLMAIGTVYMIPTCWIRAVRTSSIVSSLSGFFRKALLFSTTLDLRSSSGSGQ